ncbi:DNRLRE domain-containing protein [Flavobacteriaceae bacterium KMM 6897]|nr:DNRLRE domain-containing protein [Flavobacteriaceae bacterium KMM 6897]
MMMPHPTKIKSLILLIFVIFFQISCEKDSDLFLEAVLIPDNPVDIENTTGSETEEVTLVSKTVELSPTNDAYVQEGKGYDDNIIRLQPTYRTSYLMFDLSTVEGQLENIELKLTVDTDDGDGTIKVFKASHSNWTESKITSTTAPLKESELASISKAYKVGATEKINIDKNLIKNEMISFVLTQEDGNDISIVSKENPNSNGPKLIVTYKTTEDGEATAPAEEEPETTTNTTSDASFVNFSTFGAKGDGTTDDTQAIQAALNKEGKLVANAGATFKISGTLKINQSFEHSIDWNGATILTSSTLNPMINIDKRASNGGTTSMSNLLVDGKAKATRGIQIQSRVNFKDVQLTDFFQTSSSSPAAIYLQVYNDEDSMGDYMFDGLIITKTVGASNGSITDSWGASNSMLLYWKEIPSSPTKVTIQNGSMNNSWGEDAGLLYILDQTGNGVSGSLGSVEIKNMTFFDSERRAVKGFSGNVTFENSTFTDPLPSNPNIQKGTKSGLVVFGGNNLMSNIKFNNCEFVSRGYDGRVIGINAKDVEILNSTFKAGADLAFTKKIGDVLVCNNTFESGGRIYGYNISLSNFIGMISIGNNTAPSGYNELNIAKWTSVNCN